MLARSVTAQWNGSNSTMAEKHNIKVTSDEVGMMGDEGEVMMAVNWPYQHG